MQTAILLFAFWTGRAFMSQQDELMKQALRLAGDMSSLRGWAPVGGGMISQAARITSERGEYLLKWGGRGLRRFFEVEARGLALLAAAGAVRVPKVLAWHDPTPTTDDQPPTTDYQEHRTENPSTTKYGLQAADETGFILLEWLPTPPNADRVVAFEALGRQLAALHRATAPAYGLDHDNYLGIVSQPNGWMGSWAAFFCDRRLRPQGELAGRNGHLSGERALRLGRLLDRVDTWLGGHTPPPALLHGDLWSGNVLLGPGGAPALIDPAVSYADRETELAYTALFGGFPETFYRAYDETWPLPDGWQERRMLYNLYHLLNHLNHFGERYGEAVDAVLRRYAK
jgi:protein-ribulosamine 3-kinase